MNKLIIRHGERVTEHVISDHALVVGRDPQCDLFFADKKLSRRHARFECGDDGIRLVDLGSRNGSWVNEERVDERVLTPADVVRLGALSIQVETEQPAVVRDDEESTVYLSSEPSSDDSRTMVLPSQDLPDAPAEANPDDTGTVMLSPTGAAGPESDSATRIVPAGGTLGDEDPTLRKPDTTAEQASDERTVMLPGHSPDSSPDTGTVIFRGATAPPIDDQSGLAASESSEAQPASAVFPVDPEIQEAAPSVTLMPDEQAWEHPPAVRAGGPSSLRFVALVAAVAVLAVVVLALPLLRTLGSALSAESSLRGRALVDLLAASNQAALRANRPESLDVERVVVEPGVLGAYVLDPMGRVLAPETESGELRALWEGLGVDLDPKGIRSLREVTAPDGTTVYALPVRAQGRRLGVAVLHYRAGGAVSSWTVLMLVLGSALLLMGVAAAVVIARRWTLLPVQELRDDVESLRVGIVESLAEDRPYSDLAMIARSFNELLEHRGPVDNGGGSATFKPVVDPTLVPDDPQGPTEG